MLYIEYPQELAVMLRQAADAHHAYEQANGADANWPDWYAKWIFEIHAPRTRPLAVNSEPLTLGDL